MCQALLKARGQQTTSLKAKSCPKTVVVNKVCWNIITVIHLCRLCGCFLAERSRRDRIHLAHKAPNTIWPFTENVC